METNKEILRQLVELGNKIFRTLSINEGSYTAAELVKANQTGKSNVRNIWFSFPDGKDKEILSVSYGTFNASFEARNIWFYIWKFEQLCGIKQSQKAHFISAKEEDGAPVCSFIIDIPKRATKLKNFVSSNNLRPYLQMIALLPKHGAMVATDGRVMRWDNVPYYNIVGDVELEYIYINPKDVPNLVGCCEVKVYKDGYNYKTVISNKDGEIYTTSSEYRQPNYIGVIPDVSHDGYIQVTKQGMKDVVSLCKMAKKTLKDAKILLRLSVGSDVAQISTYSECSDNNIDISVSLCHPSKFNALICFDVLNILTISSGWTGGMWLRGCDVTAVFDNSNVNGLDIVLPCYHADIMSDKISGDIKALDRFNPVVDGDNVPDIQNKEIPSKNEDINVSNELPEDSNEDEIKQTDNLPVLYTHPIKSVIEYINILVLLVVSFRDWIFASETEKALSRLEYLAQFGQTDANVVVDTAECVDVLKSSNFEASGQNVYYTKVVDIPDYCVTAKMGMTDIVFVSLCVILVLLKSVYYTIRSVPLHLWNIVTNNVRDGTDMGRN